MSAWPEAVYVINKINYSLDAVFDIDENGIRNINALNARVDDLNEQINGTDPKGIVPTLTEVQTLLGELEIQIAGFEDLYEQIVAEVSQFEVDLDEADHRIVYIGTLQQIESLTDVSDYSIALIVS